MQNVINCGRLLSKVFVNSVLNVTGSGTNSTFSTNANSSANATTGTSSRESNGSTNSQNIIEATKGLQFVTAVSGFAKYQSVVKQGKFGDDAYFISNYPKGKILGVADGVGGWRSWGIDPGEFSFSLMSTCERLVRAGAFSPADPAAIIAKAYHELLDNKVQILGSSTACVIALHGPFGRLSSANIGDSGFLIVRDGSVVYRSAEQQHYFNTPFQLSLPPPGISSQVLSDSPESASTHEFDMKAGDMVLLATDGLFDNLPVALILKEMVKVAGITDSSLLQEAANAIALKAKTLSYDENYSSPFAVNARKNGIDASGGKPDDITIILAAVMG